MDNYKNKYLKYKNKYFQLKQIGGASCNMYKNIGINSPKFDIFKLIKNDQGNNIPNDEYKIYLAVNNIIKPAFVNNQEETEYINAFHIIYKQIEYMFSTGYKPLSLSHKGLISTIASDMPDNEERYKIIRKMKTFIGILKNEEFIQSKYPCTNKFTFIPKLDEIDLTVDKPTVRVNFTNIPDNYFVLTWVDEQIFITLNDFQLTIQPWNYTTYNNYSNLLEFYEYNQDLIDTIININKSQKNPKKVLIYCHAPYSNNIEDQIICNFDNGQLLSHWWGLNGIFKTLTQTDEFKDLSGIHICDTVDIQKEYATFVKDGFNSDFIENKLQNYDLVMVPDCDGDWFNCQVNNYGKTHEDLLIIVNNMINALKDNAVIVFSKFMDYKQNELLFEDKLKLELKSKSVPFKQIEIMSYSFIIIKKIKSNVN